MDFMDLPNELIEETEFFNTLVRIRNRMNHMRSEDRYSFINNKVKVEQRQKMQEIIIAINNYLDLYQDGN